MSPIAIDHCPLCGSSQSSLFDVSDKIVHRSHKMPVSNRLCTRCGLVYQSPRMSDAELDTFYEHEYRQLYQGSEGPSTKDLAVQRLRAAALVDFTQPFLPGLSRHLDIGCSAGLLVQGFQSLYQSQPVGIEPGEAYRQYARQQGLKVYATLDELHAAGEAHFDLVSLAHVLEHLPEPVEYLSALRAGLLEPAGHLLVEVPNLYAHDSFEIAHLVSYSAHTLQQTLQQAGYQVITLQAHGRPRSELLPLYLTALARPTTAALASLIPEQGVPRKRRWGMMRRSLLERIFPRKAWLPLNV